MGKGGGDGLPLKGVLSYVEVYGENENYSRGIINQLRMLGAEHSSRLSKKVTHFVFQNGRKSSYEKALQHKIPIVSVHWIKSCRDKGEIVNAMDFPAVLNIEETVPTPLLVRKRIRNIDICPEPLHVELTKSEARLRKRFLRAERQKVKQIAAAYDPIKVGECIEKLLEVSDPEPSSSKILSTLRRRFSHVIDTPGYTSPETDDTSQFDFVVPLSERIKMRLFENDTESDTEPPAVLVGESSEDQSVSIGPVVKMRKRRAVAQRDCGVNTTEEEKRPRIQEVISRICDVYIGSAEKTDQEKSAKIRKWKPTKSNNAKIVVEDVVINDSPNMPPRKKKVYRKNRDVKEKILPSAQKQSPKKKRSPFRLLSTTPNSDNMTTPKIPRSCTRSPRKLPSLALTSMNVSEAETVRSCAKKLGCKVLDSRVVKEGTTHVVVGRSALPSLKLSAGIARGCWIVSLGWVFRSIEEGHWLPEEPFELVDEFPAAKIAASTRRAQIIVGRIDEAKLKTIFALDIVAEKWIIDSVARNKLMSVKDYLLA